MKGVIRAGLVLLLFGCLASRAAAGVVKNGSFENDGYIGYVTNDARPEYWCDVSYDESEYAAYVLNDWSTDGDYSLTMYSYIFTNFEANDTAAISQSVYLTDVDQLIFDVYLYADSGGWKPDVVTAAVLIDDYEVWNSDGLTYTGGQFAGRIVTDINEMLKDGNTHVLSLRLSADVTGFRLNMYFTQWDAVMLWAACNGAGYLLADLNRDCIVDINDLEVFADGWLDPNGPDLTDDNDVDFEDFAVFAEVWMSDDGGEPFIPDPNFVFLDADLNDDGVVDYGDILVLSSNWLGGGGSCIREDLSENGFIDFVDFALLAQSWRQMGDLYGL